MQLLIPFRAIGTALTILFASAAQAQGLICSTEFSAGLAFDMSTKQWKATTFRPESKYIVARSEFPNARWEIRTLGSKTPVAFCKNDFSERELLTCQGFGQEFHFNKGSMRFIKTYTAGFWNEEIIKGVIPNRSEGDDTPAIAGGFCTRL